MSMELEDLSAGTEEERRWKIIAASKASDLRYLTQLLDRLRAEDSYTNRCHVVRAVGNIGDSAAEPALLELLGRESGRMLGDAAASLAKLQCGAALPQLEALRDHEEEWVRQNVKWAIKRISEGISRSTNPPSDSTRTR